MVWFALVRMGRSVHASLQPDNWQTSPGSSHGVLPQESGYELGDGGRGGGCGFGCVHYYDMYILLLLRVLRKE